MKRAKLMMETFDDLLTNLNWRDGRAKMAVWAYNSHLGDPREIRAAGPRNEAAVRAESLAD